METHVRCDRELIVLALQRQGHRSQHAAIIADTLMYAELRGNNQGVVKLVTGGLRADPNAGTEPVVIYETPVSCLLDGVRQQGMVVTSRAVDRAMHKASVSGMSIVGVSNYASATGALGCWCEKMAKQNLISIVMTQCPEMVAPHGSYEPIFGTNPIAIGVPVSASAAGGPVVLDMATSAMAWYGLVEAKERGSSIPSDVAYDESGHETTDPAAALRGALRSFDRSYKGSHLALIVELLAGALPGASMTNKKEAKNWGTTIICIQPGIFGDEEGFKLRARELCDRVKNAKKLPGVDSIQLPSERGNEEMLRRQSAGCIPMLKSVYTSLCEMAAEKAL